MNCPSDPGLLLDYATGRLNAARAATLANHVRYCPACADTVLGYAAVSSSLDGWEVPPVSMDFNRRLWARIDASDGAPWYSRLAGIFRLGSGRLLLPLAAAALVIVSGFVLNHPYVSHPAAAARVSADEVDQTERTLDEAEQTLDDIQLLRQFDAAVASPGPAKPM